MKQPLKGNLALNFLFKDQDFSDIIRMKTDTNSRETMRHTSSTSMRESVMTADEESKVDVTKIKGYFKRKSSHEILTVQDFINKLNKTGVLKKFLSKNDSEFAGIKVLFAEFYVRLEKFINDDVAMQKDCKYHMNEIHESLMFQLHREFFSNNRFSDEEITFYEKMQAMQSLPPSAFSVPAKINVDAVEIKFAWKLAMKQLLEI